MSKKNVIKIILICVVIICIVIILDYLDIMSALGLSMNHLNYSMLDIVINAIIVIAIASFTYFAIDYRNIKKEENRKLTALLIMKVTYLQCLDAINYIEEYRTKAPEIFEDDEFLNMIDPFINSDILFSLSSEGVIEGDVLTNYEKIRQLYGLLLFSYKKTYKENGKVLKRDSLHDHIINKINLEIHNTK